MLGKFSAFCRLYTKKLCVFIYIHCVKSTTALGHLHDFGNIVLCHVIIVRVRNIEDDVPARREYGL